MVSSVEAQTPTEEWEPRRWLEDLGGHHEAPYQGLFQRAWERMQDNALLLSGDPEAYIRRRCGTVEILDRILGMDGETLTAALLDAPRGDTGLAAIEQDFGEAIARLSDGMARMDFIHELHAGQHQAAGTGKDRDQTEKLRKMFLAMAEDARVVLIKLAEQLYDMRALRKAEAPLQQAAARETLDIFAPLANRLGIWKLKWELEDLAFRYQQPETYQRLAKLLEGSRRERETYIREIVQLLQERFAVAGIRHAEIYGRPKHIYSIWKKMQRKGVDFDQLFDILAVRAHVDTLAECYMALGIIHSAWQPIQGEFDDYIAVPKKNGYKSLHTAVYGPHGQTFEAQVRTHEMHRLAEFGVASHWRYKEGVAHDSGFEQKLAWLRQVLQGREDAASSDILDEFNSEIIEDRVYALTPQGKIIDLPQGGTALDFAYSVHTSLGHRCRGSKVNGKMVPLTHVLKTGDQVEIISAKEERPSKDWLGPGQRYLKSPRSLAKVRQWFKHRDQALHLSEGRAALDKELRRLNLAHKYEHIAQLLHYHNPDELFVAIGRGELPLGQVAHALKEQVLPAKPAALRAPRRSTPRPREGRRDDIVQVQGVEGLLTQMAGCCKPMPPDPLVGYITRGQGVTIHRQDCPQMLQLQETEHERLIEVEWYHPHAMVYSVDIEVEAYDRTGLLRDISSVMSAEKINITSAHTGNTSEDEDMLVKTKMLLTIEVHDAEELSSLLVKIEQLQNVVSAKRRGT